MCSERGSLQCWEKTFYLSQVYAPYHYRRVRDYSNDGAKN